MGLLVIDGVIKSVLPEAISSQQAGVTLAAGQSPNRVITARRDTVIDPQPPPFPDNVCFPHMDQRRMDAYPGSDLVTGFCAECGDRLESLNKFRSAVRIPAVIQSINTNKDVARVPGFRERQRHG